MHPLAKTCLIDSTRTSVYDCDDPYYDENISMHTSSHSSSRSIVAPQLGNNLMRVVTRDPYEIYDAVKLLGDGSMGTVRMVKKRQDTVGGSARMRNLSMRKRLELHRVHPIAITICSIPLFGKWFETCTGLEEYTHQLPKCSSSSPKSLDDTTKSFGMPSMSDFRRMVDMNISMHQPNHIRINNFLKKEREQGNYEPFYALKSIHLDCINNPTFRAEIKNEIEIMRNLDNAHIVRLIETYEHRDNIYMVMELMSGGDLYSRDPYTEDQAARIINSIVSAVSYMHKHDISHRDLKYENIMFASNHPKAEVKIIDFGLSKKYMPNMTMKDGVGTVYTMSPQVLEGDYTNKADVWAIGVLAYMLLSSQMPFYGRKKREILEKIMKCQYDFKGKRWAQVSNQAKNFVSDLLQYDPADRPSAEEAKQSMWLNMRNFSSVRTATEDDMEAVAASIEKFSEHATLHKLGLMVIAHKSSCENLTVLRKAFKKYDTRKSGAITMDEFKECIKKYGYNNDYVEHLFRCADLDGTGTIKYTEFLAATIESTGLVTEERIAEAFDRLDSDDSGFISFENLRELFGDDVPDEYIDQVIKEVDVKHDRRISYDEFLSMWGDEINERQLENVAGINRKRTVTALADEMIEGTDDEQSSGSPHRGDFFGNDEKKQASLR